MSYNMDEHLGDNHYNCPVVAYYPEVIAANMPCLSVRLTFIHDYVGIAPPQGCSRSKLTEYSQAAFP